MTNTRASSATPKAASLVVPFGQLTLDDLPSVGGKNASLGEMVRELGQAGVRVPNGFAVTAEAFRRHLREAGLDEEINATLEALDVRDTKALAREAAAIRAKVRAAALPDAVRRAAINAYAELSKSYGETATDVAVRSSATAEDLPTASFAGQQDTYLNIRGAEALDVAIRACMASLFTDRAIVYRSEQGIAPRGVALSVGVQKMVRSDLASAGVMFTLDTESGFRDVVLINGSWGLGEVIVKGRVNPDEFWVHKPTARAGFRSIIRKDLGDKQVKMIYGEGSTKEVREIPVPERDRARLVLDDDEIMQLANWSMAIEAHYSQRAGRPTPMDLEWAKDGRDGSLWIVQARPETVHAQAGPPSIDVYRMKARGRAIVTGKSVGNRVGSGAVRIVAGTGDLQSFKPGEVLVAPMTDPDWEPVLKGAAAVVTDQGGRTCHAAIVSREHGIPCVVGTGHATETLHDGQVVTVSCAEGDVGRVYEGAIEFEREEIDPATLPEPKVPLMLNLASPEPAFRLAQLPSAGVGLLRIEFLISNWVGVHPMALLHPERVEDDATRAEIRRRGRRFESLPEFFVDRLAHGVAQIAAAFHPRDVIVRFSDFKTNEYAGLLGGEPFEPEESNPMIGFRGASRYYDERYREAFALECEAIRRVRESMGLANVKVMIPFCRTLEEGRKVLAEMERSGLVRGKNDLEVYVMCEIPNNVVLAKEFAELFDGFSIGSNDLTQLVLGVDRDSELLAHVFDERDPGVKSMIAAVVATARSCRRKIGICGQAPSDYPEFAEWLASIGIDSMSLNPDSLAGVARRLAKRPGALLESKVRPGAKTPASPAAKRSECTTRPARR
ncbi:MAG: phosphoenolpyruvate synthase [Phycisphaerales bacterium]|nr:phosphoenolpyruvate synthase [Phycisphaerales bacterium]